MVCRCSSQHQFLGRSLEAGNELLDHGVAQNAAVGAEKLHLLLL